MITCPACSADIDVEEEDLDEGDLFDCTECGANLRTASLKPLELMVVKDSDSKEEDEEEDEDFDEEEEEEEEEKDDLEDEIEEEEDEEEEWN